MHHAIYWNKLLPLGTDSSLLHTFLLKIINHREISPFHLSTNFVNNVIFKLFVVRFWGDPPPLHRLAPPPPDFPKR